MADNITIIRLEVSGTVGKEQSSANSSNISPGTLIATAGVKGKLYGKTGDNITPKTSLFDFTKLKELYDSTGRTINPEDYPLIQVGTGVIGGLKGYYRNRKLGKQYLERTALAEAMHAGKFRTEYILRNSGGAMVAASAADESLREAKTAAIRNTKKYGPKMATAALAAYSIYSQYQSVGYNLSGASHAAQVQQRTTQGATFATGLGLSIATGQYWATGMMLAGKAWQLAQQNRQELYQIRSSQIISQVMQERLVKDTIQRRF